MPDVAFVIEHPYIDALACFREPIKALAALGEAGVHWAGGEQRA